MRKIKGKIERIGKEVKENSRDKQKKQKRIRRKAGGRMIEKE